MAKERTRRGDPGKKEEIGEEGVGRRFKKGSEDLDQLEGLEKQRDRSRKTRRKLKQAADEDPDPDENYPLIESDEKSRKRVKNRFQRIADPKDALDEFGS